MGTVIGGRSFVKTVPTAGTAVPLETSPRPALQLLIRAKAGNTGLVYIGGADVTSANGLRLATTDGWVDLGGLQVGHNGQEYDTGEIYVNAANNNDGVEVFASEPKTRAS